MDWEPISLNEINNLIKTSVSVMDIEVLNFWNSIKITPKKWIENHYNSDDQFWVVAKTTNHIIYYNDIEEGFNISKINRPFQIEVTSAEQDELHFALIKLLKIESTYS